MDGCRKNSVRHARSVGQIRGDQRVKNASANDYLRIRLREALIGCSIRRGKGERKTYLIAVLTKVVMSEVSRWE